MREPRTQASRRLAGQLAAEKFGVRGAMAGDVCDVIGLASDALEEQIAFPMADFEEAAE